MEVALDPSTKERYEARICGFNPCFHGSSSRSLFRFYAIPRPILVSILVFMEVALDPEKPIKRGSAGGCFNPCFHGSSSRSIGGNLF